MVVQWLGPRTSIAGIGGGWAGGGSGGGSGSIPGPGTKIPQASLCGQKKKKKTLYLVKEVKGKLPFIR